VRASNPDFIFSAVFRPEVGLLLKRSRELGIKAPVIGIEFTPDDAKVAGEHGNGFEFTTDHFEPTEDNPWAKQFYADYKKKHNQEPDFYAANYYEAVYVVAELIRRARAKGGDHWNGAKLMTELKADPKFRSVYGGEMTFQENGVAAKRVGLFEVQGGEKKFVKFVAAE
jgi:branched-chain amino acid transport system substrate-binding protein